MGNKDVKKTLLLNRYMLLKFVLSCELIVYNLNIQITNKNLRSTMANYFK